MVVMILPGNKQQHKQKHKKNGLEGKEKQTHRKGHGRQNIEKLSAEKKIDLTAYRKLPTSQDFIQNHWEYSASRSSNSKQALTKVTPQSLPCPSRFLPLTELDLCCRPFRPGPVTQCYRLPFMKNSHTRIVGFIIKTGTWAAWF